MIIYYASHIYKTRRGQSVVKVPVHYLELEDRSRYTAAKCRELRKERGVGRPVRVYKFRGWRQ